jgi:hypothetical protein
MGTVQTCEFIKMCLFFIMGYINNISAVSASCLSLYLSRITHQDYILLILFVENKYKVKS